MPIRLEEQRLGPAPALIAWPQSASRPPPAALWFHGLGADKHTHLPEIQLLAEAGFLAIGIDAAGHGARRLADFEQRFSGSAAQKHALFVSLVAQTIAEVPAIIDALFASVQVDRRRVAVAGVSMGGCIVYGIAAAERRIRAAAALLGSPEWTGPGGSRRPDDSLFPTALLSITAASDEVVPPRAARALHQTLRGAYRETPQRLRYREIPGAAHLLDPEDWEAAVREAIAWLVTHTA